MNAPAYPLLSDPITAPVPYTPNFASVPHASRSRTPPERLTEGLVIRDGARATYDVHLRTVASASHPLQDGACVAPLPGGGAIIAVSDATTNAVGVAPEDACQVVMQTLQEVVSAGARNGHWISPHQLLTTTHLSLRRWLNERPPSVCGVAQTIVVITDTGFVQTASVGDTRVLVFQARRTFRRARLIDLNPQAPDTDGRTLRSALGQGSGTPLRIELSQAQLKPGDLLLLGSDGGLPTQHQDALRDTLQAYTTARQRHQATLEALCATLEAQGRRLGAYDDDRTIVIAERLPAQVSA